MKILSDINLLIVLFIGFVDYIGIGLVYPIFSIMLFDHHYDLVDPETSFGSRGALLGLLFSLTPLSQFLTSQMLGSLSDIKGRRFALIWGISAGCLGYTIAVFGICFSSLPLLFIYTILSGISDSSAAVAQAVVADISTKKNKAKLFGYFNSSLGLGFTIGPFIGGKLADPEFASWAGYSLPFVVAGFMMFLNLFLVLWKFPETHLVKEIKEFNFFEQLYDIVKAFNFKGLRWLFFGGFAFSSGWSFFNEFLPILWIERFQFTASDIGNFYGYSGLWYAFSAALLISPLLRFFSPEKLVFWASLGCAISLTSYAFVDHVICVWVTTPFVVCFLAICFSTASTVVSNRAGEDCQGEVLGIFQSIQALAMGLNPLFFGLLIGYYPVAAVWGAVISMLFAALAFWRSPKKKKRLQV